MAKTSTHRLVFIKDHSLNVGDEVPNTLKDDLGVTLPAGGYCMVDSTCLHLLGQYVVTISHYPEVGKP